MGNGTPETQPAKETKKPGEQRPVSAEDQKKEAKDAAAKTFEKGNLVRIQSLLSMARKLNEKGNYEKALELYDVIISNVELVKKIDTDKIHEKAPEEAFNCAIKLVDYYKEKGFGEIGVLRMRMEKNQYYKTLPNFTNALRFGAKALGYLKLMPEKNKDKFMGPLEISLNLITDIEHRNDKFKEFLKKPKLPEEDRKAFAEFHRAKADLLAGVYPKRKSSVWQFMNAVNNPGKSSLLEANEKKQVKVNKDERLLLGISRDPVALLRMFSGELKDPDEEKKAAELREHVNNGDFWELLGIEVSKEEKERCIRLSKFLESLNIGLSIKPELLALIGNKKYDELIKEDPSITAILSECFNKFKDKDEGLPGQIIINRGSENLIDFLSGKDEVFKGFTKKALIKKEQLGEFKGKTVYEVLELIEKNPKQFINQDALGESQKSKSYRINFEEFLRDPKIAELRKLAYTFSNMLERFYSGGLLSLSPTEREDEIERLQKAQKKLKIAIIEARDSPERSNDPEFQKIMDNLINLIGFEERLIQMEEFYKMNKEWPEAKKGEDSIDPRVEAAVYGITLDLYKKTIKLDPENEENYEGLFVFLEKISFDKGELKTKFMKDLEKIKKITDPSAKKQAYIKLGEELIASINIVSNIQIIQKLPIIEKRDRIFEGYMKVVEAILKIPIIGQIPPFCFLPIPPPRATNIDMISEYGRQRDLGRPGAETFLPGGRK